ncbi:MAG TPA: hypothetical protein VGE04_09860, partial [Chloroflexia bacterium]
MPAVESIKSRRNVAKSLAYYFTPTSRQLRTMLLVAGLTIVLFATLLAWRTNAFVHLYQAILGVPVAASYEAWETVPCPEPGNPNKLCRKYTNTTQP